MVYHIINTPIRSPMTIVAARHQYDYGQALSITGINLPDVFEAHFSTVDGTQTVTMLGHNGVVEIPDELFQVAKAIVCYIYLHDDATDGRTVYTIKIPVKERPKPSDVEPTPVQQDIITQAIAALNDAVTQTGQDVESADASAQAAQDAQTAAESARDAAQASETAASQSETNAAAAASSASQSATNAAASESSARTSATSAARDADRAEQAAEGVEAYVERAEAAQNASEDARDIALEAKVSAQASAATASEKASEAISSATTASQSASTAVQAKTDAITAKTASQTAQGLAESARDTAQGYASDAQGYANDAQASAESISASASQITKNSADILKAFPTDTASGAVASFSDGADDLPLKSLIVDINPIQDLSHGDPSPTNICPISGWTSVGVNHSGADMTNPTTITINLGQTVYGGKLDVLSGKALITMAMVTFDGSIANAWIKDETCNYFYTRQLLPNALNANIDESNQACNIYPYGPITNNSQNLGTCLIWAKLRVRLADMSISLSDWNTMLSKTPMQFVYKLDTPITIQLTPNQINSLYGANNIFADTGDTSCEYRADTRLYIEKLTQPTEDDMVANSAITSGQFFMVGNSLYRALANIASGATITVGTNAERVSLSDALNLVNA